MISCVIVIVVKEGRKGWRKEKKEGRKEGREEERVGGRRRIRDSRRRPASAAAARD